MASLLQLDRPFEPALTSLTADSPCRSYSYLPHNKRGFVPTRWDALKALVSEVYWLTQFWDRAKYAEATLVVVGAAKVMGGAHYRVLAELFPSLTLELWDQFNVFDDQLDKGLEDRIVVHQEAFPGTLDQAQPLFLSLPLAPSLGGGTTGDNAAMAKLWDEQLANSALVKRLQPESALLGFRLPFSGSSIFDAKLKYLTGTSYFQCFGSATSTETCLVPSYTVETDGTKVYQEADYELLLYEQKLFFYNSAVRSDWEVRHFGGNFNYEIGSDKGTLIKTVWLDHIAGLAQVPDEEELINCFDTMYLFYVIERYLIFSGVASTTAPYEQVLVTWNWIRQRLNDFMKVKVGLSRARMLPVPDVSKIPGDPVANEALYPTRTPERVGFRTGEDTDLYPKAAASSSKLPSTPGAAFGLGFFET